MLFEMLVIFVIITLVCLILTIFLVEDYPKLSIPFIMFGMIFSVLCTYGWWKVDFFYTNYNASLGNTTPVIYSTTEYGTPYSYVFVIIFFIFMALLFLAAYNCLMEALKEDNEK